MKRLEVLKVMSSTDGGTDHLKRRAWAAVYRYRQFIDALDKISESSFPHNDGKLALSFIREYFAIEQRELLARIETIDDFSSELVKQLLPQARRSTSVYTKALGMILRSTNLRNSFEIYHSLKKLSKAAVDSDVRLIVSSEWTFIPFTVPMNFVALPNFIFVGNPAAESNNLLVTPLSGHEIGHSVWKKQVEDTDLLLQLTRSAKNILNQSYQDFGFSTQEEYEEQETPLVDQILAKSEELFCDLVGLYIFGSAYIYAFEYYVAPGQSYAMERYPSDQLRIKLMALFAKGNNISCDESLFADWKIPVEYSDPKLRNFSITDKVLEGVFEIISQSCTARLVERGIAKPDDSSIIAITQSFARGVPYEEKGKLSEVVNALWRLAIEREVWKEVDLKEMRFYNQVALKTIEVQEFRSRIRDYHAKR